MITDQQTNKLFLADCLPKKQPVFYKGFENILKKCHIPFDFLIGTKDIWAVDYMPIQVEADSFIQFTYNPDYLQSKKYRKTISDVDAICRAVNIKTRKSEILVDGGNVVKGNDKVIMCDKVFQENSNLSEKCIIKELEVLFQIDKIIFVPWDAHDFTGHADGMVRFIDDDTVLINDYSSQDLKFQRCFRMALHNAGLDWVELPFLPPVEVNSISAKGIYINYLQMGSNILVPVFGSHEDNQALKVIDENFKSHSVIPVNCEELSKEGGLLNCISWNIKR